MHSIPNTENCNIPATTQSGEVEGVINHPATPATPATNDEGIDQEQGVNGAASATNDPAVSEGQAVNGSNGVSTATQDPLEPTEVAVIESNPHPANPSSSVAQDETNGVAVIDLGPAGSIIDSVLGPDPEPLPEAWQPLQLKGCTRVDLTNLEAAQRVRPDEGQFAHIYASKSRWSGKREGPTLESVIKSAKRSEKMERAVSMASYAADATKFDRANALALRSFFIDLDVGDGDDRYPSMDKAREAAIQVCNDLLPPSVVVCSGGGLHLYWILDSDCPAEQWVPVAKALKEALAKHSVLSDRSVTADAARCLRVPGTYNTKRDARCEVLFGTSAQYTLDGFQVAVADYDDAAAPPEITPATSKPTSAAATPFSPEVLTALKDSASAFEELGGRARVGDSGGDTGDSGSAPESAAALTEGLEAVDSWFEGLDSTAQTKLVKAALKPLQPDLFHDHQYRAAERQSLFSALRDKYGNEDTYIVLGAAIASTGNDELLSWYEEEGERGKSDEHSGAERFATFDSITIGTLLMLVRDKELLGQDAFDLMGWLNPDLPQIVAPTPVTGVSGSQTLQGVSLPKGYELRQFKGKPTIGKLKEAKDKTFYFSPVCSELTLLCAVRDADNDGWGYYFALRDRDNHLHLIAMGAEELLSDDCVNRLARAGLIIYAGGGKNPRGPTAELVREMVEPQHLPTARWAGSTGWSSEACESFWLPQREMPISNGQGEHTVLKPQIGSTDGFGKSGSLEGWQSGVAALARGNALSVYCISKMFAGPLLLPLGKPNTGIHLYGSSSTGKSTTSKAAGSVWGGSSGQNLFSVSWNATVNGLEGVALSHCDAGLVLDEVSQQANPENVGRTAYLLGNGTGRGRAQVDGSAKDINVWRLGFISNGETPIEGLAEAAGKAARAGENIRLIDVAVEQFPGDVVGGKVQKSAFARIHNCHSHHDFAELLEHEARSHYGHAGEEFVRQLIANGGPKTAEVHQLVQAAQNAVVSGVQGRLPNIPALSSLSPQEQRVVDSLGVDAGAGELAIQLGIVPWSQGDAIAAAIDVAMIWLENWKGRGSSHEVATALSALATLVNTHPQSFPSFDVTYHKGSSRPEYALKDYHSNSNVPRYGFRVATYPNPDDPSMVEKELWLASGGLKALAEDLKMPQKSIRGIFEKAGALSRQNSTQVPRDFARDLNDGARIRVIYLKHEVLEC